MWGMVPQLTFSYTTCWDSTLVVPRYSFADFVDLAVQEIWRYGSDAAQVPARLTSMLTDLSAAALPEHLPVLRQWSRRIENAPDGQPG